MTAGSRINLAQWIKWTIYSLLLLNWALYAVDEWGMAQHTLRNGGSLLDWTTAFGTTLDEAAWFGLLFIWELETYALDDHAWNRTLEYGLLAIRGICYLFLAHTVLVWGLQYADLVQLEPEANTPSLCELVDQDVSFTRNLDYTLVDASNCDELASGSKLYRVDPSAITDSEGYAIEKRSAWIDLQDAITWLLIMFSIEIAIWLQDRKLTGGPMMALSHSVKLLYAVLFFDAAYWAWGGHALYAYDQLLWIGGFWVIEYNVKKWKDDIEREDAIAGNAT